ncbi:spindle and kinetochore-associated protein 3 isoform X2 [Cuculus canorus]|uniref:spindle and kinetochore-associated protein 3 isoform X2 n=1 Tax=Cuculus canorus TaxID=55661 RepID=UPI0023AB08D0|nr:spindle and kinetochore-associated protein 3 isoform X2 [Cuculus canorus]XP_053912879.1 spindle and kinetochore-associated protein 3 isoform X2 [Cuculus canorus]
MKEDVSASLDKCSSEKQPIHEFLKASEVLMQRNAADLGKIRELFRNYGYKPHGKDSTEEEEKEVKSDSMMYAQNKSDEEKLDEAPHLPACTKKPPLPEDSLRDPQLSDFGLTQYAFSRPWGAGTGQRATNAYQENSNRTPVTPRTPSVLPKTPKCMLKMDDYECVTPKLEQFGISEHTMCLNEDYTMSLIRKTAQAVKKFVKKDDHEVNVSEMTSKEIMATPRPKPKVASENADWMASPMVFVFCTPDVKISSRTYETVLSKSPKTNELPLPSHTETPQLPKFEAGWLKTEAKEVKQREKIETKNGATNKQYREDRVPFAVSSDEYLERFGDPSPPKIKQYDQLLDTPPPPEITRIPDDVLQILSKYNRNVDSSKVKKMENKAGNTTRYENDFTDYCDKENGGLSGIFKTKI